MPIVIIKEVNGKGKKPDVTKLFKGLEKLLNKHQVSADGLCVQLFAVTGDEGVEVFIPDDAGHVIPDLITKIGEIISKALPGAKASYYKLQFHY